MSGRANFAAEVLSEKQKVYQWMRKWLRENDNEMGDANVSTIIFVVDIRKLFSYMRVLNVLRIFEKQIHH